MKKRKYVVIGIAAAAALVGGFCLTHVRIDGAFFPKDAAVYDLTEHALTEEDYRAVCERFPEAEILWTVPFQGARLPMDTEAVTVASLTKEEAESLDLLPALKQVDALNCTDYEALAYLRARRPDCEILCRLTVGGAACDNTARELTAEGASFADLRTALTLLPQLENLTLTGTLPSAEELVQLQQDFPGVSLRYTVALGGKTFPSDTETLDLAGASLSAEDVKAAIALLPQLKEVNLTGSSLPDGTLKSLINQFPDVFFLCELDFAGKRVSTGLTEVDLTGLSFTAADLEAGIPFFPRMEKLILGECNIPDEELDALNNRWPQVRVVWSMQIGLVLARTDDTVFFPAGISEAGLPQDDELYRLRYCTDMVAIDIGHSKATNCEWAAYMPHLRYLILADTFIDDISPLSGLKELIYLELFKTGVTDYSPLLGCTALQDLNIGDTHGDPAPLSQMTWMHNLQWHGALEVPDFQEEILRLAEQLPDTNVTLKTVRNIGDPWRFVPNYYVFRDLIGGAFFDQQRIYSAWGQDKNKIMACDRREAFAGDVLAEIVRYRIDNGIPIPGLKNLNSEKAEILYQTMKNARP